MHVIARIMRLLATHYIYREVRPDTFVNNRLSAALDTGKPVTELFTQFVNALIFSLVNLNWRPDKYIYSPENKHTDTTGFSALVSL
jgi:hypothetical protein